MIDALVKKIDNVIIAMKQKKKKRLICHNFHREFASCIPTSSRYFRACHENRNTYFELDMPYNTHLGFKFVHSASNITSRFTLNYYLYYFPVHHLLTRDELLVNDIEAQ